MTEAVAFLLVKDGKFLAEKRKKSKEAYPGMLAVPGGRMEEGETRVDTLVREMKEELSVTPEESGYFCSLDDPDVYGGLTIHYFWIRGWVGDPIPGEAEELVWIGLSDLEMIEVPIDREAVRIFQEMADREITY